MDLLSREELGVISRFLDTYHALKKQKKVKNKSDFNKRLAMPPAYFSFFENEERPVPEQYIDKLGEEFHISTDWVRYNKGDMFAGGKQAMGTNYSLTGNNNQNSAVGTGNQVQADSGNSELRLAQQEIEILKREIERLEKHIVRLEKQLDKE